MVSNYATPHHGHAHAATEQDKDKLDRSKLDPGGLGDDKALFVTPWLPL